MNTSLSPQQVRIVALLGLLAACALAWWLITARQASQTSAPAVTSHTLTAPADTSPAKPVTRPHSTVPVRPATKPAAVGHKLATHGLPLKVAQALKKHRVVVVALYIPGAVIDRLARAESKAGAKSTGAGFVSLDVFRQQEGAPLLRKIGVVNSPAVLVIERPAKVYARLVGFVDRTVVAQAVADARR